MSLLFFHQHRLPIRFSPLFLPFLLWFSPLSNFLSAVLIFLILFKLECKQHIFLLLSLILNKSLSEGTPSDKFKEICIIPLHKKKVMLHWLKSIDPYHSFAVCLKFWAFVLLRTSPCERTPWASKQAVALNLSKFTHVIAKSQNEKKHN